MFTSKVKRVVVILAVVAVANLMAAGPIHATVIADSVAGFSGTQGLNGWSYDEWASGGANIDGYSAASATQLALFDNHGNYPWGGAAGVWLDPYLPGYPHITSDGAQGAGADLGMADTWAIRRWTSTYTGPVTISGVFQRLEGTGGNGMTISVMQNATTSATTDTLFSSFYAGTNNGVNTYSVTASVKAGDTIDFTLDPMNMGSYGGSTFTATIASVPEPSTLALLGTALLGLLAYAWRRRK